MIVDRVHNSASTMNRLSSILPVAQVLVGVEATSKKRAFEEAGLLFENLHGLSRAVFQLAQPIGFDAPDEQPVNLLIFLLVPEAATQKHLEILSEIAELLSDTALRESIKSSTVQAGLHQLIAQWQSAQTA